MRRLRGEKDLAAEVEAAWKGFRSRLADHLASMEDGDVLCVELVTGGDNEEDDEEWEGATPYLQFHAFGDGKVHVEAVSNVLLADTYRLAAEAEDHLIELGWDHPREDEGLPEGAWENFSFDAERREADRVAVVAVTALRQVYDVVHPSFLDAEGLEVDPDAPAPPADEPSDARPEPPVVAFACGPDDSPERRGRDGCRPDRGGRAAS